MRPGNLKPKVGLPNNAPICVGTHHGRSRLALERLGEWREVRHRSQHAVFREGMRVALYHQLLSLEARGIAAELTPGDEELLIGREAVDLFGRLALCGLLERAIGNLQAGQVADRLSQYELPVDVN